MKRISLVAGLVACLGFCGTASAVPITVDFRALPDGTPTTNQMRITDQYEPLGIRFRGFSNPVFTGAVFEGSGRSHVGLTHSITNPTPASVHGIRGLFSKPVGYLALDLHANRIGATADLTLFFSDASVQTLVFRADDFLKGKLQRTFDIPITEFHLVSSEPDQTPVGIRNLEFSPIPEPSTLALMALGIAGIGYSTRRKRGLK